MKNILFTLFICSLFSCKEKREPIITKEKETFLNDSISLKTIEIANKKGYENDVLEISYPITEYDFINEIEKKNAQDFLSKIIEKSENLTEIFSNINAEQKVVITKNDNGFLGFGITQYSGKAENFTRYYDIKEKKFLQASDIFFPQEKFQKLADFLNEKNTDLELKATDEDFKDFLFYEDGSVDFLLKETYKIPVKREEIAFFINDKLRFRLNIPPEVDCGKVPCVALSFDDGPGKFTPKLLEILKENDAKATFFVLGSQVEKFPQILKQINDEGHQIGNHTWSHKNLIKLKKEALDFQVKGTNEKVAQVIGKQPTTLRPPYGSFNPFVVATADMPIVLWNVDTQDWKNHNPTTIFQRSSMAKNGDIILAHDIHKTTIDAMPKVIKELKSKGFHLVTIDDLFYGKNLEKGKIYDRRK